MLSSFYTIKNCFQPDDGDTDNTGRLVATRVLQVEQHLGNVCQSFASITRKTARLRDAGDKLASQLLEYAKNEQFNHTTRKAMKDTALVLSSVEDYRNSQVERLDKKVVNPLTSYRFICNDIKKFLKLQKKVKQEKIEQQKVVEKGLFLDSSDPTSELCVLVNEIKENNEKLLIKACKFEKDKLQDIKEVLLHFLNIQVIFHTKALELYSSCYDSISTIDENEDFRVFKQALDNEHISKESAENEVPELPSKVPSFCKEETLQNLGERVKGAQHHPKGKKKNVKFQDDAIIPEINGDSRLKCVSMYTTTSNECNDSTQISTPELSCSLNISTEPTEDAMQAPNIRLVKIEDSSQSEDGTSN